MRITSPYPLGREIWRKSSPGADAVLVDVGLVAEGEDDENTDDEEDDDDEENVVEVAVVVVDGTVDDSGCASGAEGTIESSSSLASRDAREENLATTADGNDTGRTR